MNELGELLKKTRQGKNLSIEEVSTQTAIRRHFIEAIESGNLRELPPVYGLSFLKNYAKFLSVNIDGYEKDLPAHLKPSKTVVKKEDQFYYKDTLSSAHFHIKDLTKPEFYKNLMTSRNLISTIMYIAIFLIAAFLLYYFIFEYNGKEYGTSFGEESETLNIVPDTAVIGSENVNEEKLTSYFDMQDSIMLDIFAFERSWVKIEMDGVRSEEIMMLPEMRKQFLAKNFFILTQGNVGALQITRNGQALEPLGSRGSVSRNVKITRDSIIMPR